MRGTVVILGLLVAGCDSLPNAHSRNDINEIVREETSYLMRNDSRFHARIEELESEVSSLENEVSSLESEVSSLKREVSYLD